MSRNIKKYPIPPIDIQISDKGKFADIAFLVDRHDFMEDIAKLRRRWVGRTLISNNEIDHFINLNRNKNEALHFWKYYLESRRIVKHYGLSETYIGPVLAAILCGIVTNNDYKTILKEHVIFGLPEDLQIDKPMMSSSHRVRKVDKLKQPKDNKAISTVQRDREWYWLFQTMGYRKLSITICQTLQTVRSAVDSYNNKLQTYYKVV